MNFDVESFVCVNDKRRFDSAIKVAREYGYRFPNENIIPAPTYEQSKKYFKNAKLILHTFYNDIIGKKEMQITTAPIIKSYPQYADLDIRKKCLFWNY